jgi:hypothetical protein
LGNYEVWELVGLALEFGEDKKAFRPLLLSGQFLFWAEQAEPHAKRCPNGLILIGKA